MGIWWKIEEALTLFSIGMESAVNTVRDEIDYMKDGASELKEDFQELSDICKEGFVELSSDALDMYLDYKVEKIERFFENLNAVISNDPYTDGKKEGYNKAAQYYEQIYIETEQAFEDEIKRINSSISEYEQKIDYLLDLISKRKAQIKHFQAIEKHEQIRVSNLKHCSREDLKGFTAFPKNRNLLDLIASTKVRKMRQGQLDGFSEAKQLYQNKLNALQMQYEVILQEKINVSSSFKQLYDELLKQEFILTESIVSLELVR